MLIMLKRLHKAKQNNVKDESSSYFKKTNKRVCIMGKRLMIDFVYDINVGYTL